LDLFEAIFGRRSTRWFTDEPVAQDDLDTMLRAAAAAPSGHNHQMWYFIVIRNKALQKRMRRVVVDEHRRLAEMALQRGGLEKEAKRLQNLPRGWIFFDTAPISIAVCERMLPPDSRVRLLQGIGMSESEVRHRRPSIGLQSVAAATQNLLLAAHGLGYGACWMTAPNTAAVQLEELLEIEPPLKLRALVPIGRPAREPKAPPPRKPMEEIVRIIDGPM
jgi:nitroreductase